MLGNLLALLVIVCLINQSNAEHSELIDTEDTHLLHAYSIYESVNVWHYFLQAIVVRFLSNEHAHVLILELHASVHGNIYPAWFLRPIGKKLKLTPRNHVRALTSHTFKGVFVSHVKPRLIYIRVNYNFLKHAQVCMYACNKFRHLLAQCFKCRRRCRCPHHLHSL